jgi:tetratricopeptide (TPR) repeat protein
MTSSREWGDRVDAIDPELGRQTRRRVLQTAAVAVGFAAVAGLLGWAVLAFWPQRESLLIDARSQLSQAATNETPHERLQAARSAEQSLRAYTRDTSARRLLLAAALAVQQAEDPHTAVGQRHEAEELLTTIHLTDCELSDLTLAATLFYQSGKLNEADWMITGALAPSPDQTPEERRAVLRAAIPIRLDLGDERSVLEHCYELAELAPDDPFPWRTIAMVYEYQNTPEALIEAYQRLLGLDGDSPDVRRKLAERLLEVGNAKEAREQVEWLQEHRAAELENAPVILGELLLLEGRPEEAQRIAEDRLAAQPDDAGALLLKSRVLVSRQEFDAAIELLDKLLQHDPIHPTAHYLLGIAYARRGDRELAEKHLDRQRNLLNTMVELHRLQRLVGRNPHDVEMRLQIASLYDVLEDPENAGHWRRAAEAARAAQAEFSEPE